MGLNTISEFNQIIDTAWDITQVLMLGFTFQICGVDEVITEVYKAIERIMSIVIRVTNHASGPWALMEAEMVTRENIRDLFPDGSVHSPLEFFSSILTGSGSGIHVNNMREAWPALFESLALVKLEQDSVTKTWICYQPPFVVRNGGPKDFNLPWEKEDENQVTRFYWWVTADPVDALVFPRTATTPFGFPQVPGMTAVALAKPVGGDIAPDDEGAEYVAKLIPLSTINASFAGLSGGLQSLSEVLH